MIPSRTWRRLPGRRGSGGLFIQPAGKAPSAPAMLCGAAPQHPGLVTPGDKVPEMATLSQHLGWLPCHGARDGHPAVAPKTAALPQHPIWRPHLSTQCPRWQLYLSATLAPVNIVPHARAGADKTPPFPAWWASSGCPSPWRTYPMRWWVAGHLGAKMATGAALRQRCPRTRSPNTRLKGKEQQAALWKAAMPLGAHWPTKDACEGDACHHRTLPLRRTALHALSWHPLGTTTVPVPTAMAAETGPPFPGVNASPSG